MNLVRLVAVLLLLSPTPALAEIPISEVTGLQTILDGLDSRLDALEPDPVPEPEPEPEPGPVADLPTKTEFVTPDLGNLEDMNCPVVYSSGAHTLSGKRLRDDGRGVCITITGTARVTLDRIRLTGSCRDGIQVSSSEPVVIKNVDISGCTGNLIRAWGPKIPSGGRPLPIDLTIRDSWLHSTKTGCVEYQSEGQCNGPRGNAISLWRVRGNIQVLNNQIWATEFGAVRCNGCQDLLVRGNAIQGSTRDVTIWAETPNGSTNPWKNIRIEANLMDGAGRGRAITMTNCSTGPDFQPDDGRNAVITRNHIRGFRTFGAHGDCDTRIVDNLIDGDNPATSTVERTYFCAWTNFGMAGKQSSIEGNRIKNCRHAIVIGQGSSSPSQPVRVIGNTLSDYDSAFSGMIGNHPSVSAHTAHRPLISRGHTFEDNRDTQGQLLTP